MPATKTRQYTLYGGSSSDFPITDLANYSDVARFTYKLRDIEDIKNKNNIIQKTLNSLKETWLNCNPKLFLIPKKFFI